MLSHEIIERPRSYRESCSTKASLIGRGDKKACLSAQVIGRAGAKVTDNMYTPYILFSVLLLHSHDHCHPLSSFGSHRWGSPPPPKDRSTAGTARSGFLSRRGRLCIQ